MNVFNLISAGGGSGSGLYIWKKSKATPILYIAHSLSASNNLIDAYLPASVVYHVLEGDTVTAHTDGTVTVDNPTIITIDGNTSETTYYLKYGKYYSIAESTTGEVFVSTLNSDTRVFLSWSNNNYKLFVQGGISTTYPINYYASKNELEFIDYVVSDKEDAYPDGAEQGGFYYERYMPTEVGDFGFTKIVKGSFVRTALEKDFTLDVGTYSTPCVVFVKSETGENLTSHINFQCLSVNNTTEMPASTLTTDDYHDGSFALTSPYTYGENLTKFHFYAYQKYYKVGEKYNYWILF